MRSSHTDDVQRVAQALTRLELVTPQEFDAALRFAPSACRESGHSLLEYLVRVGLLSRFQAERIREGAARRLVLGPYQLLAPLGRGASGMVYLARDRRTDQPLALKLLPPSRYRDDGRTLKRFLREMAIGAEVDHPHLARCYDSGVIDDVHFIAMEFVPGCTLRQQVLSSGPLSLGRAARVFAEVADALHHIHQRGLVHRDLKPGNVMITPNRHAKILDLGFALIAGEPTPQDRAIIGGRGYVVGTMDFIAPEQVIDATRVDGRADLYSLGCSLYFSLTGQVPFPGGTSQEKLRRHRQQQPPSISTLNPAVPPGFIKLVEQLMAKQPEARPSHADEVRQLLLFWAGHEPELPLDVTRHPRRLREPIDLEG
ncbi:MAG: serine/threonine protein kinase [Gemmataceae bacterium]|nr:serine/threonine protein kinase [Gemmataceae bacterium]